MSSSSQYIADSSNGFRSSRKGRQNSDPVEVISLDLRFCAEVCALEPLCYPHPWSSELIAGEFKKDVSLRLGLLLKNELVAYCFNYLVLDELHILNLAVSPRHQSRGFGKKLLRSVLAVASSQGATFATLEVRESNLVAQKLYAQLGFRVAGMRKNYYRDNSEHALVMECDYIQYLPSEETDEEVVE